MTSPLTGEKKADHGRREKPGGNITLPIVLVTLGVTFLLQNFGVVSWSIWETIWRFWPVLLILGGIETLLGRRGPWIAIGLAVGAFVASIAGSAVQAGGADLFRVRETVPVEHVAETLGELRQANVAIQFGTGEIYVTTLPSTSEQVIAGEFRKATSDSLDRQFTRTGSTGRFALSTRSHGFSLMPFRRTEDDRWDIWLSPRIPLDLSIRAGACRAIIDLTNLQVRQLFVEAGASKLDLRLPRDGGETHATIRAGAADMTIDIPTGVAARIHVRSGLSTIRIDDRRFPRSDDFYQTPDFDTATNRVILDIEGGASSIRVR